MQTAHLLTTESTKRQFEITADAHWSNKTWAFVAEYFQDWWVQLVQVFAAKEFSLSAQS